MEISTDHCPAHVRDSLGDTVDMVLGWRPTQVGIESTVPRSVEIRRGAAAWMISQQQLEEADGVAWKREQDPLPEIWNRQGSIHATMLRARRLHLLRSRWEPPPGRGLILDCLANAAAYAAKLYAALHAADKERLGLDWRDRAARKPEWAGIRDRLRVPAPLRIDLGHSPFQRLCGGRSELLNAFVRER